MIKWRKIPNFNGYEVNNTGVFRVNEKIDKIGRRRIGRILTQRQIIGGYLGVVINRRLRFSHRLIALAFLNNPENKRTVNHKDGNKKNNNVSNLEWASYSENIKHAFRIGLHKRPYGSSNPNSFLSVKEVLEMRKLRKKGESLKKLSALFNCGITTVSDITNKKTWKNV